MDWISHHWQSLAAPAVVLATAAVFIIRLATRPKKACGGSCHCASKPAKK